MSHELIYTSVPRGLRAGASGFCTVAMTARMPDAMVERLELLSGYRPIFALGDPKAAANPIVWAHWRVTIGDRARSVLSRIAFAGADYSQRSNKFAHHIIVEGGEQPPAGPAWVLRQGGVMESTWPGEPSILPAGRAIPTGDRPASICKTWKSITGDAGWAGVLAAAFRNSPMKPAYLVYNPGIDPLPLIEEAVALLPAAMRWQVTFCTYFTDLPMGATCIWRCVVAGTPAAKEAVRTSAQALVIDLTAGLGPAPDGPLTQAARTGRVPAIDAAPPASARTRISPPLREDGFQSLPAVSRQKRRLGPPPLGSPDALDVPPLAGAANSSQSPGAHAHVAAKPPMRGWIVAILCVGCLAAASAGGYLIVTQLKKRTPGDALLTAQAQHATDDSQGRGQRGGGDNRSIPQSQPSSDAAPKEDDPVKKGTIPSETPHTQPIQPETTQPSKSKENLPPVDTATSAPASTQTSPDERAATDLPPPIDPSSFARLDPIVHPSPRPPQAVPQTQPTTDWQVSGIDRIAVLFPNGDTRRNLTGEGVLRIERENDGAVVNLYTKSSEPGAGDKVRTIGRFVVKTGLVSFTAHFESLKNRPLLIPEIRSVIESSTILGAQSREAWTSLLSFGDADGENVRVRIPFDSSRGIRIAQVFAKDVFLAVRDARGGGWEPTPDGPMKIVLKKKHRDGFLRAVVISLSIRPGADDASVIPVQIESNWDAGKKAYAKEHYDTLLSYGNLGRTFEASTAAPRRAEVLSDGEKWESEAAKWNSQAADLEKSIRAEKDKQKQEPSRNKLKELRSRIESKRPLLEIYHKLLDLEQQADEFQSIGPVEGEVRLQNGLPVGRFTFEEVPQKLKWTPPP